MRTIEYSSQFKKDFKREKRSSRGANLEKDLKDVLDFLVVDKSLPAAFADHSLMGEWKDFRDCHVHPVCALFPEVLPTTGPFELGLPRLHLI